MRDGGAPPPESEAGSFNSALLDDEVGAGWRERIEVWLLSLHFALTRWAPAQFIYG